MLGSKRKRQDPGRTPFPDALAADQVQAADRLGADVLDPTNAGEAERYSAWAGRMRDKRGSDQAAILGDRGEPLTDNWSSASVLGTGGEDGPLDDRAGLDSWETARALEVLGLDARAGVDDVVTAFRTLAKVHHPDRWAEADEAVQRDHAEAMLRINASYQALRDPAPVN
jgi:DnaJ-domain-containing protein 1